MTVMIAAAGLHMACANGHAGIVHLLISAGAVSLHGICQAVFR